jgi:hypothetical protein
MVALVSGWRFGCGQSFTVFVPRGYSYREVTVSCGSTSHTGGVNQCDACAAAIPVTEPRADESDADWFERQSGG